jgi:hypothetical protein
MASAESVHRLLVVASKLLDSAASEMREVGLGKDITRVGSALGEIFEVKRALYALRPDVMPAQMSEAVPLEVAAANRRLTRYLADALELDEAGDTDAAVAKIRSYLEVETSPEHREIAQSELSRMQLAGDVS